MREVWEEVEISEVIVNMVRHSMSIESRVNFYVITLVYRQGSLKEYLKEKDLLTFVMKIYLTTLFFIYHSKGGRKRKKIWNIH